nr:MAG: hypothetical protein [Bacteriophage sp.]
MLVNVNDICFNKLNIHSEIIYQFRCYGYGDDYYILGEYSTEEKALKVLDEIQTCIMTEHCYYTDDENCTRRFFTKEWKEIYQMPQDEDVEV